MESLVTQDQQAEGIIFLLAPVLGEKSLPPFSNLMEPAKALALKIRPVTSIVPLATPNFKRSRRVKLFIFPPYSLLS
jgi:hypothetical protein